MDKKTQLEIVKELIDKDGYVSRNWCLANYISRLSAIIYSLKEMGYEFNGKNVKTDYGHDYIYYKINNPVQMSLI